MRIRHESLAAAARAGENVEVNRATLREAGGTAAKGRASEVTTGPPGAKDKDGSSSSPGEGGRPEIEGEGGSGNGGALAGLVAMERLGMVEGNAGAEEWLKEVNVGFCYSRVLLDFFV